MGKMRCRCGYVIDTIPSPEPHLWIAIKDAEHEAFIQAEAESNRLAAEYVQHQARVTTLDQKTAAMRTLLYDCPVCHRLYWFRGADGQVEVFVPESEPPKG